MIWTGIINYKIFGAVKVPGGMIITSDTHYEILKFMFLPWLEDAPRSRYLKLVFIAANALSYSAKLTKA